DESLDLRARIQKLVGNHGTGSLVQVSQPDQHGRHRHRRVLHTYRLVSSKSYFLQWAQKLIGSLNVFYASGQSTEDPGKRLMTINLTFGSFLSVYETLSYVPHPTDPCKSLLKQEATVQVEGVPLNRYIPARNSMDELSATTQKIHKCVLLLAASRVGHFGNSPLRQFQERWMQASKKLLKCKQR
ncbi:hypothetical protein pipiens_011980, partial [Culex pipiens pipiens]